jgi:cytochrome b
MPRTTPLWDLPVRGFHWLLAACVVFSFVTAKVGGEWMQWHMRSGYTILALLLFRIAWGVLGSPSARFSGFVRGPRTALAYVRAHMAGERPRVHGHNPLGGWMVLAFLAILSTQAVSGLFVDDEIATQGPLAVKATNAFVSRMGQVHEFNQWLVAGAVALHLVAIAVYQWVLKTDLIGPMVHGGQAQPSAERVRGSPALAAVLVAAAAAAVYYVVVVFPRVPGT